MNWIVQNWPWIIVGVVVLVLVNRGTRYRRSALGYPADGASEPSEQAETARDPVTNNPVATAGAVTSVYQGRIYYFESADTRRRFEESPRQYGAAASAQHAAPSQRQERPRGHRHGGGCC